MNGILVLVNSLIGFVFVMKKKEKASAGERVALICYVKGFVKLSERKRPKKKKRNKIVQAN